MTLRLARRGWMRPRPAAPTGPSVLASAVSTAGGNGGGLYEADTAFVPAATITVTELKVKFASASGLHGTWRVGIASTFPHWNQDVVSVNGVDGSAAGPDGYVTITLPGPVVLTGGVTYAIDVYDPGLNGNEFYFGTAMTPTGLTLPNGGANINQGASFFAGHQIDFELLG